MTIFNPTNAQISTPDAWEQAYLRFETPEDEVRKFIERLERLGATRWSKEARIVELFCGRGNGLRAWERLGFHDVEGVDLSPRLIAEYDGPARCYVADCRHLPFPEGSKYAVAVQGGLHHLPRLPEDLDQTFAEIRRILVGNGRVLFVEPWLTPFLRIVHYVTARQFMRKLFPKLDALSTMIEYERATYEQWLARPKLISGLALKYFEAFHESVAFGKWNFVGKPRSYPEQP
jgi:SAM-dependent methyltransferase